jgi:hypothetical protein
MPLPESIHRAWTETEYRVRTPWGGYVVIRCGEPLPAPLLALLGRAGDPWGYITAWNPAGVSLPAADNRIRQRRLRDQLRDEGHRYFIGIGVGPNDWREPSLFVPGVAFEQLDSLGRAFGQLGIVRGTGTGIAELRVLV